MPIVWHVIQLYAAQGFDALPARDRLQGRADRALRRRARAGRTASRWSASTRAWRRRRAGGSSCLARAARGRGVASARPTPTASPTSTCDALLDFHGGHGALATMTVVRPELQFGVTELDERRPRARASARSRARSTGSTAASSASRRPCSTTSRARTASSSASRWSAWPPRGELRAYRHEGFWECMDTYKDAVALNDLWAAGQRRTLGPSAAPGRGSWPRRAPRPSAAPRSGPGTAPPVRGSPAAGARRRRTSGRRSRGGSRSSRSASRLPGRATEVMRLARLTGRPNQSPARGSAARARRRRAAGGSPRPRRRPRRSARARRRAAARARARRASPRRRSS